MNLFESRLVRGARWANTPVERVIRGDSVKEAPIPGETDAGHEVGSFSEIQDGAQRFLLLQGSSAALDLPDDSIHHIVTDPPYFDSVQYSDLAAFFRVWLRRFVPHGVDWHYSLNEAAVNQQITGDDQYESVLGDIFSECHRVLRKDSGRLIFTFHHWNPKGWADLTNALRRAGFVLINRYVIHSENPTSVHIVNQNSLVHDVVLVLGSRSANHKSLWPLPVNITRNDSYTFCGQCGSALGYILESKLTRDETCQFWTQILRT